MANKPSDVCPLGRIPGNFKHAGGSQASMANKPSDVCPLGRTPGNFDHAVVSKAWKNKPRDVCSCGRAHSGFFLCLSVQQDQYEKRRENVSVVGDHGGRFSY